MDAHLDILDRPETLKSVGLISDFSVSWVGTGGKLKPIVCTRVLHERESQKVRTTISNLLRDLVKARNITVRAGP